jgi:mono/diheme cytochrome c family protein
MKFRLILLIALAALLTACNFTLAEDVTPPPGYVPPTPMPTLGPLYPADLPNVQAGAAIFTEKCAPCHGEQGLGDGPQGLQLGVTIPAYGLPDVARQASPEKYFTIVTRGNIQRFMPPFTSLDEQQRWDVVAYALSLHITPDQIQKGKSLFETNCANCSTDFFTNQQKMSKLSEVDLARLIREGGEGIPAFGKNLSDDDLWAVTAYLRTLSFDTSVPLAQPTVVPSTQTPVAAAAGTPSAEGTPVGTEQASAANEAPGFGSVSGTVENKTGPSLPPDLAITLHGYDHAAGANVGATEVLTRNGAADPNGKYTFENVELTEGRIFIVDATYSGVTLQSEYGVVEKGQTSLTMPNLTLYSITEDTSRLVVDQIHLFFQASNDNTTYDVLALYNLRNTGDAMVAVKMGANQQEIPFLKFPKGAQALGYEATQDSAPLISLSSGFAMKPTETPYGIVAYSSVPREKVTALTQEFVLPVTALRVFVPDGVELKGGNLTSETSQEIQGTVYQSYVTSNIAAGSTLTLELSGTPKATASTNTTATSKNNTLLIGAGALGVLLLLGGVWMYWRDRRQPKDTDEETEEDEEDEEEFDSSEEALDAILALDDLHRAKKISDEAYQKRRAELKETLKGMM